MKRVSHELVAVVGFLFHYLCDPLPYVWCQYNCNVLSTTFNKNILLSFSKPNFNTRVFFTGNWQIYCGRHRRSKAECAKISQTTEYHRRTTHEGDFLLFICIFRDEVHLIMTFTTYSACFLVSNKKEQDLTQSVECSPEMLGL